MLNNNQFKKICEMSFYMLNNKLDFANVKHSQVETFIQRNISKKELLIYQEINDSSKKVIYFIIMIIMVLYHQEKMIILKYQKFKFYK